MSSHMELRACGSIFSMPAANILKIQFGNGSKEGNREGITLPMRAGLILALLSTLRDSAMDAARITR